MATITINRTVARSHRQLALLVLAVAIVSALVVLAILAFTGGDPTPARATPSSDGLPQVFLDNMRNYPPTAADYLRHLTGG